MSGNNLQRSWSSIIIPSHTMNGGGMLDLCDGQTVQLHSRTSKSYHLVWLWQYFLLELRKGHPLSLLWNNNVILYHRYEERFYWLAAAYGKYHRATWCALIELIYKRSHRVLSSWIKKSFFNVAWVKQNLAIFNKMATNIFWTRCSTRKESQSNLVFSYRRQSQQATHGNKYKCARCKISSSWNTENTHREKRCLNMAPNLHRIIKWSGIWKIEGYYDSKSYRH